RLHNVPVRAKTGSLEFVRTLGGYTSSADGRPLAFAVFANNFTGPPYVVTQTIDRVVASLSASAPQ
ncbi:MAG TPA: D-alanyl-D-alanine carboxypeptidase, partial [Rhodothermales bacterium]